MTEAHGAGVVVYREAAGGPEFLLLRAKWNERNWGFPKGHREKGDASLIMCAMREASEETGLAEAALVPLRGFRTEVSYALPVPTKRVPGGVKRVVLFAARAPAACGAVSLSDEHTDFAWLPAAAALGLLPPAFAGALGEAARAIAKAG
jgi:8-oxo-dGTP pyrophosphatase MutT (NUDIX family)